MAGLQVLSLESTDEDEQTASVSAKDDDDDSSSGTMSQQRQAHTDREKSRGRQEQSVIKPPEKSKQSKIISPVKPKSAVCSSERGSKRKRNRRKKKPLVPGGSLKASRISPLSHYRGLAAKSSENLTATTTTTSASPATTPTARSLSLSKAGSPPTTKTATTQSTRSSPRKRSWRVKKVPVTETKQLMVEHVPQFKAYKNTEKHVEHPEQMAHIARIAGIDKTPLKDETFFHGLLPREEVERKLKKHGDYLVRETLVGQDKRLTITVHWHEHNKHFLVQTTPKGYFHVGEHTFETVSDLISWYRQAKRPLSKDSGVLLKTPVKRSSWQLSHDQVRVGERLGEGAFGEVHKAELRHHSRPYDVAVKILHGNYASGRKEQCLFLKEFSIMRHLSHPNVVRVFGVAAQHQPLMIVMEYMALGSLLHYLRRNHQSISLLDRLRFISEASSGMRYLEKMSVTHRDIATRNCLLGPEREIKIADFGLSRAESIFREAHRIRMPIKWLAPETLSRNQFSIQTDVWSFGVLIWEVFADGRDPYPGMTNQTVRTLLLKQSYRMTAPKGTPDSISKLMQQCWNDDPFKRPSFLSLNKDIAVIMKGLK